MQISQAAQVRLEHLCQQAGAQYSGLRLTGFVGSCRGSTPILKAVEHGEPADQCQQLGKLQLFVPPDLQATASVASLDYEGGLLGRGLFVTWPHQQGCHCQHS